MDRISFRRWSAWNCWITRIILSLFGGLNTLLYNRIGDKGIGGSEKVGKADSPFTRRLLHTHYTPKNTGRRPVRRMADSAFETQEYTVCLCDNCRRQGSAELYEELVNTFRQLKMDSFVEVNMIRLKNHSNRGVYITLNGKEIDPPMLDSLHKSVGRAGKNNPAADDTQEW